LTIALKPSIELALCLEAEAYAMATEVLRKESELGRTNPWTSPFMEFKIAIARATLDTEEAWRAEISNFSLEGDAVIADVVFTEWTGIMLDVSTSDLPTLSTTCPINNTTTTEEQVPSPLSNSSLKSRKTSQDDGSTRQRRVAAAQAAKREILANVREDWVWPCPLQNSTTIYPRRRDSTQWCEREIDPSTPPSRSLSPSQPDPYKFDSPESVGNTVEARGWKRRRLIQEEMQWNEGLRHFVERRDAWTGAEARLEDQDEGREPNIQTHSSITHHERPSPTSGPEYVIIHGGRNHTSPDPGSSPVLETSDPSASSKTQIPSPSNSGFDTLP
ncbi:MAG: hypothetical protein Q9214_007469, partial [Letrouitia sp. 1 TL-2023]